MKTHVRICMSLIAAGLSAATLAATPEESRQQRMDEAYQDYRSSPGTRADSPGPAERAENSMKRGMHRAGKAIRHGAHKTGEAIGKGVRKTGDAMHRAGEKVEGKSQ